MNAAQVFLLLMFGHFLADYPLQGDFLAKAKNRAAPILGVPWYQAMAAHAGIHGGMVMLITGSAWLGVAEFIAHAAIDDAKCRSKLTFDQDQALHVVCKLVWLVWVVLL